MHTNFGFVNDLASQPGAGAYSRHRTPQAQSLSRIKRHLWTSVYCWSCFRVSCTTSRLSCASVCSRRPFLAIWAFFPLGQSVLHFEFSGGPLSESRIRIVRPHPLFFVCFWWTMLSVCVMSIPLCLCELMDSIWK